MTLAKIGPNILTNQDLSPIKPCPTTTSPAQLLSNFFTFSLSFLITAGPDSEAQQYRAGFKSNGNGPNYWIITNSL